MLDFLKANGFELGLTWMKPGLPIQVSESEGKWSIIIGSCHLPLISPGHLKAYLDVLTPSCTRYDVTEYHNGTTVTAKGFVAQIRGNRVSCGERVIHCRKEEDVVTIAVAMICGVL